MSLLNVISAGVDLEIRSCPTCYVTYGVPAELTRRKLENGGDWTCPNGHSIHFTESTAQRLEKEKKQLADKLARQVSITDQYAASLEFAQTSHEQTRRSLRGTRAVVTRYKKKIGAGRCPCCSHEFKDLGRHMKKQHPKWDPEKHADAIAAKEAGV